MSAAPLAVLLLLASTASASKPSSRPDDGDAPSEVTSSYMLEAVKSVSDANLENAMSKARSEAGKAAANILQLSGVLSNSAATLASKAGPSYAPDIAGFLEAVKAFRRAAAGAGLELPAPDAPKTLYSARNRRADLDLLQGFAKAADAKRKVSLPKPDKAAAAAAFSAAEAAAALLPKKKLDPALAGHAGLIETDAESLQAEALAFERALHLDAHAQADFDSPD